MNWGFQHVQLKLILIVCILSSILIVSCTSPRSSSQSKPMTSVQTSVPVVTLVQTQDLQACGNGRPRNVQGNCPPTPPCAKKCSWNKSVPMKQQCWTYLGQSKTAQENRVIGYDNQVASDGFACYWVKNESATDN